MREGYWLNYKTGKTIEIDEHERWIRDTDNAKKIGVPGSIIKQFDKFVPGQDRCRFLFWLMTQVPLIRIRGQGGLYDTYEFAAKSNRMPYQAICRFARRLSPVKLLNIVNLKTGKSERVYALLFLKRYRKSKVTA